MEGKINPSSGYVLSSFVVGWVLWSLYLIPTIVSAQAFNVERHTKLKINDIAQNEKGIFWLASDIGVYYYDLNNLSKIPFEASRKNISYNTRKISSKGNTVIAWAQNNIIYSLNAEKAIFQPLIEGENILNVALVSDSVLFYLDNTQLIRYSLSSNESKVIYQAQSIPGAILDSNASLLSYDFIAVDGMIVFKENDALLEIKPDNFRKLKENVRGKKLVHVSSEKYAIMEFDPIRPEDRLYRIYDRTHTKIDSLPYQLHTRKPSIHDYKGGYLIKDQLGLVFHQEGKSNLWTLNLLDQSVNLVDFYLFVDHSGTVWIPSINGLYTINSKSQYYSVHKIKEEFVKRSMLRFPIKDRLIFYLRDTTSGAIHWLHYAPKPGLKRALPDDFLNAELNTSIQFENNLLNYSLEKLVFYYKDGAFQELQEINDYLESQKISIHKAHCPGDMIYLITNQSKLISYNTLTQAITSQALDPKAQFALENFKYQDTSTLSLLMSTEVIVCDYSSKTITTYPLSDAQQNVVQYATDFYFHDQNLYLTTKDNGLYILDLTTDSISNILQDNMPLYSIFKDQNERLWMNSDGLMYVYHPQLVQVDKLPFPNFEIDKVYPKNIYSDSIFTIFTQDYYIEVNTTNYQRGENKLNLSLGKINYVLSDQEEASSKIKLEGSPIYLPRGARNIQIHLFNSSGALSNLGALQYKIQNSEWTNFNGPIQFNTYTYDHGTINLFIRESTTKETILKTSLYIPPYWYQTNAFYLSLLLIGLSILLLIFFLYRSKVNSDFRLRIIQENTRLKQSFLATVSHEIRTPINAIIGFSDLLKNPALGREEINKYSEAIYFSGSSLLNLINDFLFKSALDAKKISYKKDLFKLDEITNNLVSLFSFQVEEKGIYLKVFFEDKTPLHVIGDRGKLIQILTNLLQNAIKFTDDGGVTLHIAVKSRTSEVAIFQFSVIDTGIGIPKDKHDKVFLSFNQFHTNQKHNQGTGLGLLITKELVELGGGSISFTSQENKGTTFIVQLPFVVASPTKMDTSQKIDTAEILASKELENEPLRIFIAEDEKYNVLLIKNILTNHYPKATITIAYDGNKAIDILQEEEFDVIILDINLPGAGGIEIARFLREDKLHRQKNVICCTASAEIDEPENIKLYFDFLITKPYQKERIYHLITQIIKTSPNV